MGKNNKKRSNIKLKSKVLDEQTFGYYNRISDTLNGEFENKEEKELFVDNVLAQLSQEALTVSQDQTISGVVETLVGLARRDQLTAIMNNFSHDWEKACCDRVASFVMQTLLQNCNKYLEKTDDDSDEEKSLEQLFDELLGFLMSQLAYYMQHTSASHVVRVLLEVLAGCKVSDKIIRSKMSDRQNREKVSVELKPVSTRYKHKLYNVCNQIVVLPKLEDHVQNSLSNPVLQTILLCAKVLDEDLSAELYNKILINSRIFETSSDEKLPSNVIHQVGSHLVEQCLSVMPDEIFHNVWKTHFKGRLIEMAKSPVANFVLQKLISSTRTSSEFEKILKELSPILESLLALNHTGVIVRLAEACVQHGVKQPKFIKSLQKAFHCYDPPERQCKLVPLLITLSTYEIFYKLDDQENKEADDDKRSSSGSDSDESQTEIKLPTVTTVNFHGSVLVQNLLRFSNARLVVTSLFELKPDEIQFLCCDPCGSHVIEAFLRSETVSEKCRETLYQKLKGCYLDLACNKSGSRTFDCFWQRATLKQKCLIAEELSKHEDKLKGNKFGFFVHSRCAIHNFKQRPQEWKEIQNGSVKKRKLFQEIIEGGVAAKNHKKRTS